MTIAVRPCDAPSLAPSTFPLAFAEVEVFDDLAAAEPLWRELEQADAVATGFQRFDWVSQWHRHVGAPSGDQPLIVVGLDGHGRPLFLWPFIRRPNAAVVIARFFGGSHSNLNMGLWRPDIAAAMTAENLAGIFFDAAARTGVDLFHLVSQPRQSRGHGNPFALLTHQRSPDDVYLVDFAGGTGEQEMARILSSGMRGRLRTKERKLQKLAGYRYFRAANAAEVERVLDAFFAQKAVHFAAQGIANVFAEPGVPAFIRASCLDGLGDGSPLFELHAIEGGGEVLAILGGIADRWRFSSMFNSYTTSEHGRWSPGLILLTHLVAHCADRGIASFDLGAGHASYKDFFCKDSELLFDAIIPCTLRGKMAAAALCSGRALKRRIKSTPWLWTMAQSVRRRLSPLNPST